MIMTKQDILEIIDKLKELKNLDGITINIKIEDINIENN
ncbi:hypothetical protein [Spiroplasma endosymbiont of Danaus chrysippus]|nr:hypothetical protein [Spiroplasma endosymbiont of Danaus chrysippus]